MRPLAHLCTAALGHRWEAHDWPRGRGSGFVRLPLRGEAETVVGVAIGDVDAGTRLAEGLRPSSDPVGVVEGQQRIDQDPSVGPEFSVLLDDAQVATSPSPGGSGQMYGRIGATYTSIETGLGLISVPLVGWGVSLALSVGELGEIAFVQSP
jgi:hypothetical protein